MPDPGGLLPCQPSRGTPGRHVTSTLFEVLRRDAERWSQHASETAPGESPTAELDTKLAELAQDFAGDLITRDQLLEATLAIRERINATGASVYVSAQETPFDRPAVLALSTAGDIPAAWETLDLITQRSVIKPVLPSG